MESERITESDMLSVVTESMNENFVTLFMEEYISTTRVKAVEYLGRNQVNIIDETMKCFAEEEYNPEEVLGFIREIGVETGSDSFSFVFYAQHRANFELNSDPSLCTAKRSAEIIKELYDLQKDS